MDYAAPTGTPVVAVAGGTVEVAAWSGDAGRMVALRHAGGYETYYLHLSSFAPGLHAGSHVEQGQLIGRVGMTGAATGPHLDYRIKKNGVHVNPLLEVSRMPPAASLAPGEIGAFDQERDRVLADLAARLAAPAEAAPHAATGKYGRPFVVLGRMSSLLPFRALRPAPESSDRVASVPYDVVGTEEARALAASEPLSFLRVTRSEVDLPPQTPPYDGSVYAQAVRNFEELKRAAPLVLEDGPRCTSTG